MNHAIISIRITTKQKLDNFRNAFCKDYGLEKVSYSDIIERLLDIAKKLEVT